MGQGRRALAALLSIAVAVVLAVAIDEGLGVTGAATKMGRVLWANDVGDQAKFALEGARAAFAAQVQRAFDSHAVQRRAYRRHGSKT